MPKTIDYYAILQVHPNASREVIDAAYKKLASKYHPDVNASADAVEKMKKLNEAYEVLSHPSKRSAYDRSRKTPPANDARRNQSWRGPITLLILLVVIVLIARVGIRLALFALALIAVIWFLRKLGI